MSPPIRCVAFDAVGTLIHPRPTVPEVYADIGGRFGSARDVHAVAQRFQTALVRMEADAEARGYRTNEQLELRSWRTLVNDVLDDVTDHAGCFEQLAAWFAAPQAWQVFADVQSSIDALRLLETQIVIASNFDGRLHSVFDGIAGLANISTRVVSSEIGYRKPSPRFFDQLVRLCGVSPGEILMVGDSLAADITPARHAGMQTAWIDRRRRRPGSIASLSQVPELVRISRARNPGQN